MTMPRTHALFGGRGFRHPLGYLRRTPLRVKLIAAMALLMTVALVLTGFAANTGMRHYLITRVDGQLKAAAPQIAERASHDSPNSSYFRPPPTDPDNDGDADPCGSSNSATAGQAGQADPDSASGDLLPSQYVAILVDASGSPTGEASNPVSGCQGQPAIPQLTAEEVSAHGSAPFTVPSTTGGGHWRVVLSPLPNSSQLVAVAAPLTDLSNTLNRLAMFEVTIGAGVLLLLIGVGYLAVRRSLRPLVNVEHTAAAIAAGDLSRRVPEADPRTEVGQLSLALNGMLAQIEAAFRAREASEREARGSEARMRRFITDASHELRTPLTSIRGFAELYRLGATEQGADLDRLMRRIEDEAARMGMLVDDLLLLARLDQQRPLEQELVDLAAIAADAVHDAQAVDPAREVRLDIADIADIADNVGTVSNNASDSAADGTPQLVVVGDEARLRQVVGNLTSNALKHTPSSASITVRVAIDAGWAIVEVADTGPGLDPENAQRVFERFYRVEQSRTRSAGGTGLGLSIVAALVAAHGGSVEVETAPGEGATFRVRLPLAVEDVDPEDVDPEDAHPEDTDLGAGVDRSATPDESPADEPVSVPESPTGPAW